MLSLTPVCKKIPVNFCALGDFRSHANDFKEPIGYGDNLPDLLMINWLDHGWLYRPGHLWTDARSFHVDP